jgi:hypothetical protein
MMPVFHELSRAEGPSQQTTEDDGLPYKQHDHAGGAARGRASLDSKKK